MIEILRKLVAVFVSIDRIVQFDSGDSGDAAEDQILDARLSGGGHRDRLAVTAKSRRNPENIDLFEKRFVLMAHVQSSSFGLCPTVSNLKVELGAQPNDAAAHNLFSVS